MIASRFSSRLWVNLNKLSSILNILKVQTDKTNVLLHSSVNLKHILLLKTFKMKSINSFLQM